MRPDREEAMLVRSYSAALPFEIASHHEEVRGHAICSMEWASSFRACRHASPASGSCSDQDDALSTPLPEAGRRGSLCHVVSFVFTRPPRAGFRLL